ncbi:fibronectin type III domain-containing protein [Hamadaea sp. NPDC050747]|uniref:fibronectin type III domain-containing protein n=1 Tax=Hamadaea sp. NPDC050747 TaxID=3155789 RepID=UPI0034115F1D
MTSDRGGTGTMKMRLRHLTRLGKVYPAGIVLALVAALGTTVFALGVTGQQPAIADGASWLWSKQVGEASQVNAVSGSVSLRQPMIDAQGHQVRVTQSDHFVILHDLFTGRVTSIDLTRMGFSGSLDLGTAEDTAVLLDGATAIVVDRTRGLVRPVDAGSLQAIGDQVRLSGSLVGGAFDKAGRLWLGVPSQGVAIALVVKDRQIAVVRTEAVSTPGHEQALTVLDQGSLVVDRGSDQIAVVGESPTRKITSPVSLAGAVLPARTIGSAVAITLPTEKKIVTIADVAKGGPVATMSLTPAEAQAATTQPAVSFAGKVYIPDQTTGAVRVVTPSGQPAGTIQVGSAQTAVELEVREQHLFINAPDTTTAVMVDEDGKTSKVDKYDPVPETSPTPTQQPLPTTSPQPEQSPTAKPSDKPGTQPTRRPPSPKPSPTVRVEPQRPGPPVPVTALAGDGRVRLSWGRAKAGSAAVEAYTVTWEEGGGGRVQVNGATLQTTITGLTNGTSYRFKVWATNSVGDGPPALSEPVTPAAAAPPATPAAPTAKLETDSDGCYTGAVLVSWPGVQGAADYVVTPLKGGAAGANPPQTVTGTDARFAGLTPGDSFTFTVVARNSAGAASDASPQSNELTVHYPPAAPTNVKGRQISANQYVVTWNAADGHGLPITGYEIRDEDGKKIGETGGTVRTATITSAAKLDWVEVVAFNDDGEGPSGYDQVTQPSAPTIAISSTSATESEITVNFTADGDGAAAACTFTAGGKTVSDCSSPAKITGLSADTQYTITAKITTFAGSATDTAAQKTDAGASGSVRATVNCEDSASNPDPNFCAAGVPVYNASNDNGSVVRRVHDGDTFPVVCKVHGENQNAGPYHDDKEGDHWLKLTDGHWISWVWLHFDNGDDVEAIPDC